ncbi:MAG: hypothetical protein R3F62_24320 [Planctomycetota bacterium]
MNAPLPTPPALARGTARKRRLNSLVLWLRRLHLYTGLFLVPWVCVYAVSAILFNHGTWFSERTQTELAADPGRGGWPAAASLAAASAAAVTSGQAGWTLDPEVPATCSDALLQAEAGERAFSLWVDPVSGAGTLTAGPRRERDDEEGPDLPARARLDETEALLARTEAGFVALLPEPPEEEVRVRRGPTLAYRLVGPEGQRVRVSHDLARGQVRYQAGEPSFLGVRDYVLRLHLSHGYPRDDTARWIWALGVDLLALTFLFWVLSGLVMWVQMKKLRRAGLVCLGASLASALALGLAMAFSLAR